MSGIITDVRTIHPDDWTRERDGVWYVNIPFDCTEKDDVIVDIADSEEYVNKHKRDFDCLSNGITSKNNCTLTAKRQPKCDMTITLTKLMYIQGKLVYDHDVETGEYKPRFVEVV